MSWWQVALVLVVIAAVFGWKLWTWIEGWRRLGTTRRTLVAAVTDDRARVQQAYEKALANYERDGALSLEDELAFASLLPLAEGCFSKEFCASYRALKTAFAEGRAGRRDEANREIAKLTRELKARFAREMR